jgi:hypothetical protein
MGPRRNFPSIERAIELVAEQRYESCKPLGASAWNCLSDKQKEPWREAAEPWPAETTRRILPLVEDSSRLAAIIARHSNGVYPVDDIVSGVCEVLSRYARHRNVPKPELNRHYEKVATLADQLILVIDGEIAQEAWYTAPIPAAVIREHLRDILMWAALTRENGASPGPAPNAEKLVLGGALVWWWRAATGREPTFSKSMDNFNLPATGFAAFVREAVLLLPDHAEFETGFVDFLQSAIAQARCYGGKIE